MASISCHCGAVEIAFPSSEPRYHGLCCCVDCLERMKLLESKGGPAFPARLKPVDLVGLDNCMDIAKGQEHLKFFKLRSDSTPIICYCQKCHTALAGRSPAYHGQYAIMVFADSAKMNNINDIPLKLITFDKDWDEVDQKMLPAATPDLPRLRREGEGLVGTEGWDKVLGSLMENYNNVPPPQEFKGVSFDELIEQCGGTGSIETIHECQAT